MILWTQTQTQRLNELNAPDSALKKTFHDEPAREKAYQALEKSLVIAQRHQLAEFQTTHRRPELCRLENKLAEMLMQDGFAQVTTPIIMSRGLLKKMSIDSRHPLNSQIFWLQEDKCLRPMLAPHLYYLLVDLLRIWKRPVRIFEIGPCFRKESRGSKHASEFTMLNLVEMGLPAETREERIRELGALVAEAAGITDYQFETVTSEVYGDPTVHPQTENYWGNVNCVGIRSCYDEGKRCAETLFFDYHRQHQIKIRVLRIFWRF